MKKLLIALLLGVVIIALCFSGYYFHRIRIPFQAGLSPDMAYMVMLMNAEAMETNDPTKAKKILLNATRIYPDQYNSYFQLGLIYEKTGDTNMAYSNYMEAYLICGTAHTDIFPLEIQLADKMLISNRIVGLSKH